MKTNAIIRIIIWSIVLVMLLGILGAGLIQRQIPFMRRESYPEETMIPERITQPDAPAETTVPGDDAASGAAPGGEAFQVPADSVTELEIAWVTGDITILAKDGIDRIIVRESAVENSRHIMHWELEDTSLEIQFTKGDFHLFGFNESFRKDLTIEVPADWICQELELDVASADLKVQDLTIRKVDFDGASGRCSFVNCDVGDLDVDTASGDVTFRGRLDFLDFDAASASFTGEFQNTPRQIDMDGASGDLDIALPEDTGYSVTVDGMSCTLRSDFQGASVRNGTHIYGDGRCQIQVNGMSCDVTIRKLDTDASDSTN